MAAVAQLPQLGGSELEERQRVGGVLQGVEHVLDQGPLLEAVARGLERPDQGLAQALAIHGRQQHEPAVKPGQDRLGVGGAVEEVRAHGDDDPERGRDVVGDTGQAGEERGPLVGRAQGVELLELIDEQYDAGEPAAGPRAQLGAQVAGLGAQARAQVLAGGAGQLGRGLAVRARVGGGGRDRG